MKPGCRWGFRADRGESWRQRSCGRVTSSSTGFGLNGRHLRREGERKGPRKSPSPLALRPTPGRRAVGPRGRAQGDSASGPTRSPRRPSGPSRPFDAGVPGPALRPPRRRRGLSARSCPPLVPWSTSKPLLSHRSFPCEVCPPAENSNTTLASSTGPSLSQKDFSPTTFAAPNGKGKARGGGRERGRKVTRAVLRVRTSSSRDDAPPTVVAPKSPSGPVRDCLQIVLSRGIHISLEIAD